MAGYIITGKLGTGKSLAAVQRIADYLNDGRMVATNLDLYLENLVNPFARKVECYRVPDKPRFEDLDRLPIGNPTIGTKEFDEGRNGALVLDECGSWLNTRNWNDKARQPMLEWLIHARKRGWDTYFLVQDIDMIDKQAREMVGEMIVRCRRFDKMGIPVITWLTGTFTPWRVTWPKMHLGVVRYGTNEQGLVVDKWWYRGSRYYDAYDTAQIFHDRGDGLAQYLPPWWIAGRFRKRPFSWEAVKKFLAARPHWGPVGAMAVMLLLVAAAAGSAWWQYQTARAAERAYTAAEAAVRVSRSAASGSLTSPVSVKDVAVKDGVAKTATEDKAPKVKPECKPFEGYRISGSSVSMEGERLYVFEHREKVTSLSKDWTGGPYKMEAFGRCAVRFSNETCISEITCAGRAAPPVRSAGGAARSGSGKSKGDKDRKKGSRFTDRKSAK